MAKLTVLPDARTIAESKGIIDFYYWKGIPVARRWPRHSPRVPTTEESANQAVFTLAAKIPGAVSPFVRQMWIDGGASEGTTWVDVIRETIMKGDWLSGGG